MDDNYRFSRLRHGLVEDGDAELVQVIAGRHRLQISRGIQSRSGVAAATARRHRTTTARLGFYNKKK